MVGGVTIGRTEPADCEQLRLLLLQSLPGGAPMFSAESLTWRYWSPEAKGAGAEGWKVVADGRIVAHAGCWPVEFASATGELRACTLVDWAAAAGMPGLGVAILRRLVAERGVVIAVGGSEAARRVLPAMGRRLEAPALALARPLRPLAQALHHPRRDWRLPARLLRNAAWALRAAPLPPGWEATEVGPAEFAATPRPAGASGRWEPRRSAAAMALAASCPGFPLERFQLRGAGRAAGGFALSYRPGVAFLADAWAEPGGEDAWSALVALAIRAARAHPDVHELDCFTSSPELIASLERAGCRRVGEHPVHVLGAFDGDAIGLRMLDDDSFYRQHAKRTYLT